MRATLQSLQNHLKNSLYQPVNRQRRFILLAGTAALFTACGRNNQSQKTSTASTAQKGTSPKGKTIQHALGETVVAPNPSRVVALGYAMVEPVVALGIQPVGAPGIIAEEMTYLELDTATIADIGNEGQPNIEKIAALKPDLILTTERSVRDNYPLLSQIAPTVAFEASDETQWQALAESCAEVLGKQAEVEKLATEYDAKLAQLKAQVPQTLKDIEASIVFLLPGDIRVLGKESFSGNILEDAGLSRPPSQAQGRGINNISLEALDKIDGDVMFILTPQSNTELADDVRTEIKRTQASPLWSQLKAVKNDQVHEVPPYWILGNYLAANLILDDLLAYFVA
ncbi:MAG: iron-siderophore ABC transporter substrate-binding protein [Cyanobacteria bacterium P01_D01_bin.105]